MIEERQMRHFKVSLGITAVLLVLATLWGYQRGGWPGAAAGLWIALVLGIMEVSLSFENAVVNASVLKNWDRFWQQLFLTVGILIAVFGMRLLFPLLLVALTSELGLVETARMALREPALYSAQLEANHGQLAAFGGAFLLLVFLTFLFDTERTVHWLGKAEATLGRSGSEGMSILLTVLVLLACVSLVAPANRFDLLAAGLIGIATYLAVHGLARILSRRRASNGLGLNIVRGGIGGFLYLEVLDASFSFDGVIGAFAITSDVVVIMLGLAIGAIFVRSATVYLVREGTLDRFVFLKHGAHYAIAMLALIMLASVAYHVPGWLAGLSGATIIVISLWSSIRYRRQLDKGA